ncbi:MAG: hypothetical protein ACU84Q_09950 [Gammaproteobacteria bacterium]
MLSSLVLTIAGCAKAGTEYFPLGANRAWHYDVSRKTMDGEFKQKHIVETLPAIEWQGITGVPQISAGGEQYLFKKTGSGIQRIAVKSRDEQDFTAHQPAYILLPEKIEAGVTWRQTVFTRVLENTGPPWETLFRIVEPVPMDFVIESENSSVSVPAGRFDNCLKISAHGEANVDVGNYIGHTLVTINIERWYARGVGLVQAIRTETTSADAINHGEIQLKLEHLSL